ncbi:MAG: carboxypeptidase-like regulatory domain-containing protein, partial [Candidatus Sulfotelmatobacter sp.]
MQKLRSLFGFGLVVLLCAVFSFAQTGTIAGTVTDPSGAVVQGAEITVRGTATNESHKATSNSTGYYSVT